MYEEDFYYGFEPEENESEEGEYVRDCDCCGEPINKGDEVLGIVTPSGEKLYIHKDEDIDIEELLTLIGVFFIDGDVRDVEPVLQSYCERRG